MLNKLWILVFDGRLPTVERTVDRINLKIPSDPDKLLMERKQSRFIGCNVANAQHFYSKYGRDISPDAILFRQKALEVLKMAVTALDSLQVRFWLSSGTCLGKLCHKYILVYTTQVFSAFCAFPAF